MSNIIFLLLLFIPVVALSLIYLKQGCYILSFMFWILFGGLCLLKIDYSKLKINNDINARYEELTSETTEKSSAEKSLKEKSLPEKSDIKKIAKNNDSDVDYYSSVVKVNGINTLILKVKDFNDINHIFKCNKCLKKLQQYFVNAYNIKNLEIYWDKGMYKFDSDVVIQLSSISIN